MIISKFVTDDGITIFRLSGKLISSSIEKLKASLDSAMDNEGFKVVINCRNVNIVDSSVVGLLISRARMIKKKGGYICFSEPQAAISRLFEIVDIDRWLDVFPSEDEAIDYIHSKSNSKNES